MRYRNGKFHEKFNPIKKNFFIYGLFFTLCITFGVVEKVSFKYFRGFVVSLTGKDIKMLGQVDESKVTVKTCLSEKIVYFLCCHW